MESGLYGDDDDDDQQHWILSQSVPASETRHRRSKVKQDLPTVHLSTQIYSENGWDELEPVPNTICHVQKNYLIRQRLVMARFWKKKILRKSFAQGH